MLEFAKDVSARVPVRLLDSTGMPVSGVAFGDAAATLEKADGTTVTLTLTNLNWLEVTAGAFTGQGKYDLVVPGSATNKLGALSYAVTAPGSLGFIGLAKIVVGAGGVQFFANGDTIAPIIYRVSSPKHTQVQVTYSESVVMTTGPNGALNIDNYVIPGLTITSVSPLTAQQVLLTTSAQTPNELYDLTITNVEDLSGNPIG